MALAIVLLLLQFYIFRSAPASPTSTVIEHDDRSVATYRRKMFSVFPVLGP